MEEENTKIKPQIKFHDADNAIKMLPLIISYCGDIEASYNEYAVHHAIKEKLVNMIGAGRQQENKIQDRKIEAENVLSAILDRFKRWRDELTPFQIKICSPRLGRLNLPIYDDNTNSVIYLCIHKASNNKNLEWHCMSDTHEQSHPYWFKMVKSRGLLLPASACEY